MKTILSVIIILFASISWGFGQNWDWGGPIDPLQEKFEVKHYRLELELYPESKSIKGNNTVTFSSVNKLDTLRLDLIDEYKVTKVQINGEEVAYSHKNDLLDILVTNCSCDAVDIFYEGKTPIAINPPWEGGFTWEKDQLGNDWVGLSSQGEGAKIFMPALDHPSSEASQGVDLLITVPKPYFVAANGRLDQIKQEHEKLTYFWTTDYPINNYGINFTMGIFHEEEKNFTSVSGDKIPMHVWVLQENKAKAKDILEVLNVSSQTHEKYFGAYPWPKDKIAIVETPYLGMEHQTINAYGNNYRFVKMGSVNYDNLLHHELGHEWFGNKVSVDDWADFWIHEGITAYGDWLFYWEHGGEEAYLKKAESTLKQIAHSKPVVSPVNSTEEEAYHSEIYTKGAFIMHSLRWILGDDVFFPMLKSFANDPRFTYENQVNTRDFIDFVNSYTGKDLEGFFQLYLYSTDIPEVKILKKGKRGFEVSLQGIDFQLPVELKTEKGIETINLGKQPLLINSTSEPTVDPRGWLMLKK
ncbi:M1 family metallopeptidase [Algoriphagus sp. AGSA1]|uniref:M1 family metallopeptidase n=1 Tax=Algoriphagus sp. AGSA1 TaxID=2907213 RepID=UPI001F2D009C|nr:M1 family metallopeptidase [Algoriphagus sp. AGSA1]MCE7054449.1 M1 family metallopeptidase [Algoriphagus sp. AGSA1]